MRTKIFRHSGILIVMAVLLTFLTMSWAMYDNTADQMYSSVKNECKYYKFALDKMGDGYLDAKAGDITDSRVTLIDTDGTVLFDSLEKVELMENHSSRPEFVEAVKKGYSDLSRYSETLRSKTYYSALKLENGKVIRVSLTTDSVLGFMLNGIYLVGLLIAGILILEFILVRQMTNKMVAPINRIDLEHPLDNITYEELSPLLGRIHQQQKQIRQQLEEMRHNQEEYLAITEYMKDGLIVTNQSVVLSINRSAQELFDVTAEECVNHNIVTVSRNQELKEALDEALKGRSEERMLEINGRVYQLMANPVRVDDVVSGAVILVLDVTEKQKAEMMRKEFSANVSHELKTPLMSISGYAEIIENNMVKPEDIPKFAGRIHSEASRLSSLVEDIIKLSRLDESENSLPMEEVNLLQICQDVEGQLSMRAKERKIEIRVRGEAIRIRGARQILYEMVYNLCDNAIKYNHENGKVEVTVSRSRAGRPLITVADTGIGIAKEDQQRIFERFYRVDKSHSRETGGTGLGLSIVKHGAILHDAKIRIESALGAGTKIMIEF